jgi:glycosyltransferase involved in cell wall biosynthesis
MKPMHILLVDPIAYAGGSKIATARMLKMLDPKRTRVTIVTRDPDSWADTFARTSPLFELGALVGKDRGVGYFLRHIMIVFSLLWARINYGRFDRAVGASGPGIDLSLYLARKLFGYQIIQLVHGPVARSRTIGRALESADRVFYLETAGESLLRALETIRPAAECARTLDTPRFSCFRNGLADDQWPTASRSPGSNVFWASSLLKWKGLETLIGTLKLLSPTIRPRTHICYIRPRDTNLELGPGPVEIDRVHWHENPSNLDQIRAACNIYVSTSRNEPFGLSILESMAAGLAILIPRDNAYWDRQLEDHKHCLKYRADDPEDLALKILYLMQNPGLIEQLGQQSRLLARQYRADQVYREIVRCLAQVDLHASPSSADTDRTLDHAEV